MKIMEKAIGKKVGGTKVIEKADDHCCALLSGVIEGLVTSCTILSVMDHICKLGSRLGCLWASFARL